MKMQTSRVPPLTDGEMSPEAAAVVSPYRRPDGRLYNIHAALARHPVAMGPFMTWARYLSRGSSLTPRERELLILRVLWTGAVSYEWPLHVRAARAAGLNDEEIEAVKAGPGSQHLTSGDALLIAAADELMTSDSLTDPTWDALTRCYDAPGRMDVIFTVAHYVAITVIHRAFRLPLEGISG